MGAIRTLKSLLPVGIKSRLREEVDKFALRRQGKVVLDSAGLRSASTIDLSKIMQDEGVRKCCAIDRARIAEVYPPGEVYGGVNPGDRQAIYHLVAHFKPARVLEVGTHVGASTIAIAAALDRYVGESAKLTTADIANVNADDAAWSTCGLSSSPAKLLERLGLARITTFVNRPAKEILGGGGEYDLIFLDGDHSAVAVYCEISAALQALSPSGLVLLHDFYPGLKSLTSDGSVIFGPAMAAERISMETDMLQFIPLGDLPWPTKSGGNATSLALVARSG